MLSGIFHHHENPEEETFLQRKMQDKLSMFKCTVCESRSKAGHAMPYLFNRMSRGNRCPVCGSSNIQKISISVVMDLRWNKAVKERLMSLRLP
jgi:hypothetical protein